MKTNLSRRTLRVVAAGLVMALFFAGCFSGGQASVQSELNADRRTYGLRSLPTHGSLNAKAQAWAEKLARDGRLSHSNLAAGVPSCWRSIGENVGYGGTVDAVQSAYMRSPGHKANVVNGKWNYVGVGFARAGSRVYTVQVFMQGC